MTNVELVQDLYGAFKNGDKDRILELFDPRIEWIQCDGFPAEYTLVHCPTFRDHLTTWRQY